MIESIGIRVVVVLRGVLSYTNWLTGLVHCHTIAFPLDKLTFQLQSSPVVVVLLSNLIDRLPQQRLKNMVGGLVGFWSSVTCTPQEICEHWYCHQSFWLTYNMAPNSLFNFFWGDFIKLPCHLWQLICRQQRKQKTLSVLSTWWHGRTEEVVGDWEIFRL